MNDENSSEGVCTVTGEDGTIGSDDMDPKGDIANDGSSFSIGAGAIGSVCEAGPVETEKTSGFLSSTSGAIGSVCVAEYCEIENCSGSLTVGTTVTGSV